MPAADAMPARRFDARVVGVILMKDLRDALRNRWFVLYAVGFAVVASALALTSIAGTGRYGVAGFGRTAASLVNLTLLMAPLMALTVGSGAVAGERERGTLEALLAQPVTTLEVLLGKYLGAALALVGALTLGFGAAAILLLASGAPGSVWRLGAILAGSALLACAMLSVGFLISVAARRAALALGTAIFVWLGFVFVGDLGLMGGALVLKLTPAELLALALANPLQAYKVLAVGAIHRSVDLLGPAGLYAAQTLGPWLLPLLCGLLAAWVVLPLAAAIALFAWRGRS